MFFFHFFSSETWGVFAGLVSPPTLRVLKPSPHTTLRYALVRPPTTTRTPLRLPDACRSRFVLGNQVVVRCLSASKRGSSDFAAPEPALPIERLRAVMDVGVLTRPGQCFCDIGHRHQLRGCILSKFGPVIYPQLRNLRVTEILGTREKRERMNGSWWLWTTPVLLFASSLFHAHPPREKCASPRFASISQHDHKRRIRKKVSSASMFLHVHSDINLSTPPLMTTLALRLLAADELPVV